MVGKKHRMKKGGQITYKGAAQVALYWQSVKRRSSFPKNFPPNSNGTCLWRNLQQGLGSLVVLRGDLAGPLPVAPEVGLDLGHGQVGLEVAVNEVRQVPLVDHLLGHVGHGLLVPPPLGLQQAVFRQQGLEAQPATF